MSDDHLIEETSKNQVEEEDEDQVNNSKKMKLELLEMLGSTHSKPKLMSLISSAHHRVFGSLKLEELGLEEGTRSRTHVNPLGKQYLEVRESFSDT